MLEVSPNFAEFQRLARKGNVVPVYRAIVADLLSPVSAFLKLAPQAPVGAGPPARPAQDQP
jgi:anthranilate synthase component 1